MSSCTKSSASISRCSTKCCNTIGACSGSCSNPRCSGCSNGKADNHKCCPCDCPQRFWQRTQIAQGRLDTKLEPFNHEYLEVNFKCGHCAKVFAITYDYVEMDGKGVKRKRHLLYNRKDSVALQTVDTCRQHDAIDEAFFEMWHGEYSNLAKNCAVWARELFNKIK